VKERCIIFLLGCCVFLIVSQVGLPDGKSIIESLSLNKSRDEKNSNTASTLSFTGSSKTDNLTYHEEVVKPLITPVNCGQNLSTYTYFNIGGEQLKLARSSIIRIVADTVVHAKVFTFDQRSVRSECQENPYNVMSRLSLTINTNDKHLLFSDIRIDKLDSFYIENASTHIGSEVSFKQSAMEAEFEFCKSEGLEIDDLGSGLFRCVEIHAKNVRGNGSTKIIFMSSPDQYATLAGRPFVMMCHKTKKAISCYTHYRLWPSVDVGYSFKTQNLKPENLIKFDAQIRRLIEDARVKLS
jgi:hypothetical protein